jgi:dolichol-phosphate mannosyltransferase
LENKDATGNRGFGTTTPSFSSLRVTGSFGARGASRRATRHRSTILLSNRRVSQNGRSRLLLLIPAYNEEQRIAPVLREYAAYFRANYGGEFRIFVVLNGCRDNTLGVVEAAARDFPEIQALEFASPIGKGGALIEGLKLAPLSDLIGYVDADGATAPPAFHDLVKAIDQADCVIGSRWIEGARLHQAQSTSRRFYSRAFHTIVEILFQMGIHDTQCGAKVLRREAVEKVHRNLRIADMSFDINLLYSLKRAGFKILEMPTEWTDITGSKVRLGKSSLAWFLSLLRLRIFYSPFYPFLRFLRPLETFVYRALSSPPPRSSREIDRR